MNKYAFGGGFVSAVDNPTTFQEFPTGMHPYLAVSTFTQMLDQRSTRRFSSNSLTLSLPPRSLGTDSGVVFRFGMWWALKQGHCAIFILR